MQSWYTGVVHSPVTLDAVDNATSSNAVQAATQNIVIFTIEIVDAVLPQTLQKYADTRQIS